MALEGLIFFLCFDTHFFIGLESEVHTKEKKKKIGGLNIYKHI